jgi:hypothetical protein
MKRVVLLALLALLAACDDARLPVSTLSPGPEDAGAPSADRPYRPVMAGTVYHGVGERP